MLPPLTSWLTPGSLFLLLNIVIGTIYLTSRFTSARDPQTRPEYRAPPLTRSPSLLDRVKSIDFSFYKYPYHDAPIENSPDQYAAPLSLDRRPSLLERVRSISFKRYSFTPSYPESDYVSDPNPENDAAGPDFRQPTRTRSFLERVKSIDFTSFYRSDSIKTKQESECLSEPESESVPDYPTREPGHVNRSKSERTATQRRIPETMKKSASENWDQEYEEERNRPGTSRIERTVSIGEGVDVDLKADHFINKFKQQLKLQRLDSLIRYKEMLKGKLM